LHRCTSAEERRITRWEQEHILEAVQRRLDERPEKKREHREMVEHPFGTIKARTGATHFLMSLAVNRFAAFPRAGLEEPGKKRRFSALGDRTFSFGIYA
jgi:hypothetical protein